MRRYTDLQLTQTALSPEETVLWHMGKFLRIEESDQNPGGEEAKKAAAKKEPICCGTEYFTKCSSAETPIRTFYKCQKCSRHVCSRCIKISRLLSKDMQDVDPR